MNEYSINPEAEIIPLKEVVYSLLLEHPRDQKLAEFDLLRQLQQAPHAFFSPRALQDPMTLFQAHFMLFHCLYQLRDTFSSEGMWLEIHTLEIKLSPLEDSAAFETDTSQPIAAEDKLAKYYLDWTNFCQTSQEDVEKLLTDFWLRMGSLSLPDEHQHQALLTLELEIELANDLDQNWPAIKQQYRQLAMRHHPDRQTDNCEKFKQINHAYHQLKQARQFQIA